MSRKTVSFQEEEVVAREELRKQIIRGYLWLLPVLTLGPLVILAVMAALTGESFVSGIAPIQSIVTATTGVISGLAGLAGFVVGRYFPQH